MIGIHDHAGSFSDRWISYCTENRIAFHRVDCLASDVVSQCNGMDGVLWHWSQNSPTELLVARQIITALEQSGLEVFPSMATCAHFDDKVAQKYLLEAIGAPLIPTWVFFDRDKAMRWIATATWPKVFKLRCGAGSTNVRLICSRAEAEVFCRKAFGRGFPAVSGYFSDVQTRLRKTPTAKHLLDKVRRAPRMILRNHALRGHIPRQQGYLYLQEFLPNNAVDTRITIIGDRAFGFTRANRPNDFRASGSGSIAYEPDKIDKRCVDIAFRVANRTGSQSLAFDFLRNPRGEPMIAEISYCYMASAVHACQGHWDHEGTWHEGQTWPEEAILEDLLSAIDHHKRGIAFANATTVHCG